MHRRIPAESRRILAGEGAGGEEEEEEDAQEGSSNPVDRMPAAGSRTLTTRKDR